MMSQEYQTNEEIISLFLSSAETLQSLVANLSDAELDTPCEEGGWTVRQVIHHVTDDCDVWSMCIKKAIVTPGVIIQFEGFPGNEAWTQAMDFAHRPVKPALELISAHRRYVAETARHFSGEWDRTMKLANDQGEVAREFTISQMLVMLTDHMLEHIEMIERVAPKK